MNASAPAPSDYCAMESIHLLERVQSYGAMGVFDCDSGRIVACTSNFSGLLGLPEQVGSAARTERLTLGGVLDAAFECSTDVFRERCFKKPLPLDWSADVAGQRLHFFLHRSPGQPQQDILEITVEADADDPLNGDDVSTALARFSEQILPLRSLSESMHFAAASLLSLLGYTRALVYRFDEEMNGEVIAESWGPMASAQEALYLGLRFPASDIPPQARRLYEKNLVRIIADANDSGLALERTAQSGFSVPPVDLTHSLLRRPSDMHLLYMRNMGLAASVVTSLMVDGRLWGMIVCQSETPRVPPHNTRAIALGFCQVASTIVSSKLKWLDSEAALTRRVEHAALLEELEALLKLDLPVDQQRVHVCNLLKRATRSDEVSIVFDGQVGHPQPRIGALQAALYRIEPTRERLTVVEKDMANSAQFKSVAHTLGAWAGIAACMYRGSTELAVLCIRNRVTEQVSWGGDPRTFTPMTLADGTSVMGPRQSFARWVEENHQRSEPWLPEEVEFLERASGLLAKATADQRLRAVQQEYDFIASLLPLMGDMVVAWRPSTSAASEVPVFANDAFRSRLNMYAPHLRYSEWVPLVLRLEAATSIDEQRAQSSVAADRIELVDVQGSRTWVDRSFTLIPASAGMPALVTCVLRDVSEAVDREHQLLEAKRTLETKVAARTAELSRVIRDLECLSYSMAHDLRAPLRSIGGLAAVLREQVAETDERYLHAERIEDLSSMMGKMISDLLDLIRVVNEEPKLERVQLEVALHDLADTLVVNNPAVHIKLDKVPPTTGDARLLRQLFLNLFDNSIKYRRAEVDLQVRLGFDQATDRYFVQDNGSGFDTRGEGDPFQPFRRMQNARGISGSGVGLAVVARIVDKLNGEVSISSTPGVGTTVWLRLPVSKAVG